MAPPWMNLLHGTLSVIILLYVLLPQAAGQMVVPSVRGMGLS